MTEYWDLLDENREPLGMLHRRGDALPAGARHLCVEIITVCNGRILTTLRHPQKHNGGYWEVTTGSALAGEDTGPPCGPCSLPGLRPCGGLRPPTHRFFSITIKTGGQLGRL